MIVLLLLVIWVAALTPFALRKFSEHQATASVAGFHHLTGMYQRFGSGAEEMPRALQRAAMSPDEERRLLKARALSVDSAAAACSPCSPPSLASPL